MKNLKLKPLLFILIVISFSCKKESTPSTFDEDISSYIQKFPQQDTYNYMVRYTGGEAAKLNQWILPIEPVLVKAGDDKVVRMNNDTYYNMAFMDFSKGPVKLSSVAQSNDRFSSFQIMDNHNANFKNVINPDGDYILYYGEKPTNVEGILIESPTNIAVVIVRVEVRNMNNKADVDSARSIFKGIDIDGPTITKFPKLDLLGSFDKKVSVAAVKILDSTFKVVPFRLTVAAPDQIPNEVPYLNFAAGTKGGWGGPVTTHSSYETIFFDANGKTLNGSNGDYTITTTEPPVDAFWSITIYDTKRGGYLHPNSKDKYHINGTTTVKNEDGTVTFNFKKKCEKDDLNCLEIPDNEFDYVSRYYLPNESIQNGEWEMTKAEIIK